MCGIAGYCITGHGEVERDLKEIFPVVDIRPTYVLFENRFGFIRRNRDRLRLICDKVFGYCEKL